MVDRRWFRKGEQFGTYNCKGQWGMELAQDAERSGGTQSRHLGWDNMYLVCLRLSQL